MVAPLIGAGIRAAGAAARGLAKKFGKKTEEPRERFKSSYDKAKEAEDKIKAAAEKREKIKEGVKTTAKTTAKAAGATGAAGATYIVGEGMSPSQTGPVSEAIRKMQRESRNRESNERESRNREEAEKEPVKKKAGGMVKSSASKRADGIAMRGKTRGRMV
jgi:hypothetical protein